MWVPRPVAPGNHPRAPRARIRSRSDHHRAVGRDRYRPGEKLVHGRRADLAAGVDQLVEDQLRILRLAIRGESHHLVFPGVDLKAGVIGEGRIEQPERVRERQLLDHLQPVARAHGAPRRNGWWTPIPSAKCCSHGQLCRCSPWAPSSSQLRVWPCSEPGAMALTSSVRCHKRPRRRFS
mgnify:CR=1 FL=1